MTRRKQQHIPYYNKIVKDVITQSLEDHARTAVVRIDLTFPQDLIYVTDDSKVITRFISSLKSRLNTDAKWKNKGWGRNYKSSFNYVWVREYGGINNRKHYHVLLFLNKDLYHSTGDYRESEGNLAALIKQAWASANGLDFRILTAPVNFHRKVFYMNRNSVNLQEQIQAVTQHATYLTKYITKRFGDGNRSIGSSTIRR